jgi:hypothetical protein
MGAVCFHMVILYVRRLAYTAPIKKHAFSVFFYRLYFSDFQYVVLADRSAITLSVISIIVVDHRIGIIAFAFVHHIGNVVFVRGKNGVYLPDHVRFILVAYVRRAFAEQPPLLRRDNSRNF